MIKRLFRDLKKYSSYCKYAAKASLNAEVAGSYLNRLWWVFNPLCMMLVYTIIFTYVFQVSEQYFPLFIFIGLTFWDFFNRTVNASILAVKHNKGIIGRAYLPKFILIIKEMQINFRKMLFSGAIIVIMMFIFRPTVSWRIICIVPVFITEMLFTFGLCCILLHYGVYVEDLKNVVRIILRFAYYGVGIFYNIEHRIHNPVARTIVLDVDPMSLFIHSFRQCLIYNQVPDFRWVGLWFGISLLLCLIGVHLIYKYENSYAKAV